MSLLFNCQPLNCRTGSLRPLYPDKSEEIDSLPLGLYILLSSTIGNVLRTEWRILVLILGCKGSNDLKFAVCCYAKISNKSEAFLLICMLLHSFLCHPMPHFESLSLRPVLQSQRNDVNTVFQDRKEEIVEMQALTRYHPS